MLDLSRLTAGKLVLQPESLELGSLAEEVLAQFTGPQAEVEVSLVREGKVEGNWDRRRIEQVVTNLVGNAIKYGEQKPVVLKVYADQAEAVLEVRDQGMGIAPENLRRIFERFERAAQPDRITGLGLGLYISRQLVEAHGGRIEVQSVPGCGSTFKVRLPAGNQSALQSS
jgi:signal transduction histidine kinase